MQKRRSLVTPNGVRWLANIGKVDADYIDFLVNKNSQILEY